MSKPKSKLDSKNESRKAKDVRAQAKRAPEPDGKVGDGADRDAQVDQRPKSIPDDGMLGGDVSR